MNRYNFIAPAYDFLKRIIFGNKLENASTFYLQKKPEPKTILIVGGGTGEILKQFSANQTVYYVESSSKMIHKALQRKVNCTVVFHHCNYQQFDAGGVSFDLICFPFFLDQFNDVQIGSMMSHSSRLLKPTGSIVITDFIPVSDLTSVFQKLLLRTVIVFFTITTKHPISKIFNIVEIVKTTSFQMVSKKYFVKGMVIASLWKKAEH